MLRESLISENGQGKTTIQTSISLYRIGRRLLYIHDLFCLERHFGCVRRSCFAGDWVMLSLQIRKASIA